MRTPAAAAATRAGDHWRGGNSASPTRVQRQRGAARTRPAFPSINTHVLTHVHTRAIAQLTLHLRRQPSIRLADPVGPLSLPQTFVSNPLPSHNRVIAMAFLCLRTAAVAAIIGLASVSAAAAAPATTTTRMPTPVAMPAHPTTATATPVPMPTLTWSHPDLEDLKSTCRVSSVRCIDGDMTSGHCRICHEDCRRLEQMAIDMDDFGPAATAAAHLRVCHQLPPLDAPAAVAAAA